MIRVLIAEDSITLQQLLIWTLNADPDITVVGVAKDGREAVAMTRDLKPDVITMDINMPVMNGFEATRQIMSEQPTPIIIVTASIDVREVSSAMTALQAGALALLEKPASTDRAAFNSGAKQLIRHVKAMAGMKLVRQRPNGRALQQTEAPLDRLPMAGKPFKIIAVAASTGGPAALSKMLGQLPKSFPLPVLVVQHIAPGFINGFVEWLDSQVTIAVKVAAEGERLLPGTAYLAPEDWHLGVTGNQRIALSCAPPLAGFRPSASHLFESVSLAFKEQALGVIMTGMGNDGLDGARVLCAAGGTLIAQDEASSVVYGMPRAVQEAGLAQLSLPLSQIAPALLRLVMEPIQNKQAQGEPS